MGLFGRKKKAKKGSAGPLLCWATNAPEHWPALHAPALDPNQDLAMNTFIFAAHMLSSFGEDKDVKLGAFARTYLSLDGVLMVPVMVEDQGTKVPVFLYPEASSQAAAHFLAVWNYLETRGVYPVYYAPAELPEAQGEVNPFAEFWAVHLEKNKDYKAAGTCGMWWVEKGREDEDKFTGSRTQLALTRIYTALDGIESYVTASILKQTGHVKNEKVARLILPKEPQTISLTGPEEQPMLLDLSQEKGVRFFFPITTSKDYRDTFLENFAGYCEEWKKGALKNDFTQDEYGQDCMGSPAQWWGLVVSSTARTEEEGGTAQLIGGFTAN